MAQIKPEWEEIDEFAKIIGQLVEKYPERFAEIEPDSIVAYSCINKTRPERNKQPYKISGASPPESFTNTKTYFVKIYHDVWERTPQQKIALAFSALSRIDTENPGKVRPLDYADQENMVATFGANWHERDDLPNLLTDNVTVRD